MSFFLEWTNVLIFLGVGVGFIFANLWMARIVGLRPSIKSKDGVKESPYECGEPTIGSAWVRFDIRFYTVALLFIIFDVEVAFLFPWSVVYKTLGWFAFIEVAIFLVILAIGYAYCWVRGDLDWIRSAQSQARESHERRDAA